MGTFNPGWRRYEMKTNTYGKANIITRVLRILVPKTGWVKVWMQMPIETEEEE